MKKKVKELTRIEFISNWTKIDEVVVTMVDMYIKNDEERFNNLYPQIMATCPECVQNLEIEVDSNEEKD